MTIGDKTPSKSRTRPPPEGSAPRASIARGTGEVDAVYHIAYDAMAASVAANANDEQAEAWREVTGQRRVLSYDLLASTLSSW